MRGLFPFPQRCGIAAFPVVLSSGACLKIASRFVLLYSRQSARILSPSTYRELGIISWAKCGPIIVVKPKNQRKLVSFAALPTGFVPVIVSCGGEQGAADLWPCKRVRRPKWTLYPRDAPGGPTGQRLGLYRLVLRATAQVTVETRASRASAPDVVSTRSSNLPGNETCSSIHSSSQGAD